MIVDWAKAQEYLNTKLRQSQRALATCSEGALELGRLQGRVSLLEEMLNLPNALMLLDTHDKEEAERDAATGTR